MTLSRRCDFIRFSVHPHSYLSWKTDFDHLSYTDKIKHTTAVSFMCTRCECVFWHKLPIWICIHNAHDREFLPRSQSAPDAATERHGLSCTGQGHQTKQHAIQTKQRLQSHYQFLLLIFLRWRTLRLPERTAQISVSLQRIKHNQEVKRQPFVQKTCKLHLWTQNRTGVNFAGKTDSCIKLYLKGNVTENIQILEMHNAVFFYTMKVNGDWICQTTKGKKS